MPATVYERLLAETKPARIEDDEQHDSIRSRFGDLLSKRRRTVAEDKLMDLLGVLIEDYDRRHSLPPDGAGPADRAPVPAGALGEDALQTCFRSSASAVT